MGFTNLVFSFWNTQRLFPRQLFLFSGDENNWANQLISCWVCPASYGLDHAPLDHGNTQASMDETQEENIFLLYREAQWFEQGHAESTWKTQGSQQSTNPPVLNRSLSFLCFLRHFYFLAWDAWFQVAFILFLIEISWVHSYLNDSITKLCTLSLSGFYMS